MANQAPTSDVAAGESDPQRVGETLKTMRELRGVTPLRMAKALGISRSYVYNLESGRKPLTYVLLARAAEFLDVPQIAIMRPECAADNDATEAGA